MGKDGKGVSRRELLTFWRRPLEELAKPLEPAPPPPKRPPPLRPPGMMHELMLVNTCIRCGKCMEACPASAIQPLPVGYGHGDGTPYIDARKQPCVLCNGLKCTHVCPSGALIPVYVNRDVTMGTAVVDQARCLTHLGQSCDKCLKTCPQTGAIVSREGKIYVDADHCVGCGLCERTCPTEPQSIRVVPRP